MSSENEPKSAQNRAEPVYILGVALIVFLIMTMCVVGLLLVRQIRQPSPIAQQDAVEFIPTASLPTAAPVNAYKIRLPVILSQPQPQPQPEAVSVPEQIWQVTKVDNLAYKLAGQNYDLATFTRIDGLDAAQGYCIDQGLDIPDIGTEYLLNAEGIFIPLQKADDYPFQRFLKIQ